MDEKGIPLSRGAFFPLTRLKIEPMEIGYNGVLMIFSCKKQFIAIGDVCFHSTPLHLKESNYLSADTAVEKMIDQISKHQENETDSLDGLQAILLGGCNAIIGRSAKKNHDSQLDIGLRIIQGLEMGLASAKIPVFYQLTGGDHIKTFRIWENRAFIYEEVYNKRKPNIVEIKIDTESAKVIKTD